MLRLNYLQSQMSQSVFQYQMCYRAQCRKKYPTMRASCYLNQTNSHLISEQKTSRGY